MALLLADQHEVWLFRSSAVYCGCVVSGKVLLKAGQVNPGSGGVWRLIRREHEAKVWTKHVDPRFILHDLPP